MLISLTIYTSKKQQEKCVKKNKGSQFDPQIADTFLDILKYDYEKIKSIQEKYIS